MSYSGYASSVISKKNDLNFVMINVHNLDFEGIWKSQAGEKLLSSLQNIMTKITTETVNLKTFANAIKRIDECIEIDAKIAKLSAALAAIDTTTKEGAAEAAAIRAQINQLKQRKEQIKNEIKAVISGFGSVGTEYAMAFTGISAASWDELIDLYEEYSKLSTRGNILEALTLYDENGNVIRDGAQYFDETITSIKAQYTGVERNYYVAKKIIELSLEAGVKIPYKHNGTTASGSTVDTRNAVPTSAFASGVDCNAFVSYIIFGEDSTEKWLEVGQYENAGVGVALAQAQSGDVFANGGHVGMIVDHNSETGEYVVLHSTGGEESGTVRLEVVNENWFKSNGHTIRRVDSTYVSDNLANVLGVDNSKYQPVTTGYVTNSTNNYNLNSNNYNTTVSLSTDMYNYTSNVSVGSVNMNGDIYNGEPLNAPQGLNVNGPMASETWYDLNMNGVVNNMEKLYGFSNLEASIREDGVKVLSGINAEGQYFEDLVMVAADVQHSTNSDGTFERGQVVETSLGTGIVVDYCERAVNERKATGNIHFDIATAWHTGEYKERAYAEYNNK